MAIGTLENGLFTRNSCLAALDLFGNYLFERNVLARLMALFTRYERYVGDDRHTLVILFSYVVTLCDPDMTRGTVARMPIPFVVKPQRITPRHILVEIRLSQSVTPGAVLFSLGQILKLIMTSKTRFVSVG